MRVTVHREAHFNAAHRLFRKDWSDQRNQEVFGACSNPHFHGHNYVLIVSVTGEVNPETGYVIDLKVLKDLIYQKVEKVYDHRNLNVEVEDFIDLNPTAENIAVCIWKRLRPELSPDLDLEVKLYETPRNAVTYKG